MEAERFYAQKRARIGETFVPSELYLPARQHMAQMPRHTSGVSPAATGTAGPEATVNTVGAWTQLGPGNIGGRTRALLVNPTTPTTLYAAGVGGGVWKSTDAGGSWTALGDSFANLAVSSMAMSPGDPNTIYAGTGEGYFNIDAIRGDGIFKTSDGGTTWTQLSSTHANADFYYVNKLAVSKANNSRLYAATRTGVWRSADSGSSWTQILAPGNDGCQDLALRTDQTTDYLFASCGGFYPASVYRVTAAETATGTASWTAVFSKPNEGRTSLAISPSNQSTIYALAMSLATGNYQYGLLGVYLSTDGGTTWTARIENTGYFLYTLQLSNPVYAYCYNNWSLNQGWYDNVVAVDPLDSTKVWTGGVETFRSDSSGTSWGWGNFWFLNPTDGSYAHADDHVIAFDPRFDGSSNSTMYLGTDGGVFVLFDARESLGFLTTDPYGNCYYQPTGGPWASLNNGYAVTQFYMGVPYPGGQTYFGGTQDNGVVRGTDAAGVNGWKTILGGDGGFVAIDSTYNRLYAENTGLSLQFSADDGSTWHSIGIGSGDTGLFISPFAMDPSNTARLWTGGNYAWRSNNGGTTNFLKSSPQFGGTISAITTGNSGTAGVSSPNVLVGTNNGLIYFTTDGNNSTPGAIAWSNATLYNNAYISSVAFDPYNTNVAYATVSTFGVAHVWKSTTGGSSWFPLTGTGSGALPDVPVHSIVIDPYHSGTLYIGTDLGIFTSTDGGGASTTATWSVEQSPFPYVSVDWLTIDQNSGRLFAFTHGRGAWRVKLGMGTAVPQTVSAAFASPTVQLNGTTSLNFTITNPNSSTQLTGITLLDYLPPGLLVANTATASQICGTGTLVANAPYGFIGLSNGTLAGGASCSFSVNVVGSTAGAKNNTATASSIQGGAGNPSNATLYVMVPPTANKWFNWNTTTINSPIPLTFQITNPNASHSLSGLGFTDSLPAGMTVANPNGVSGSCGGGIITATAGATSISLAGATLAASAQCTFAVNVTETTLGTFTNTVAVNSAEGGTSQIATASVTLVLPEAIATQFGSPSIPLNGTTTLAFYIYNQNPGQSLSGVGFTDTLPAGLVVANPNGVYTSCAGTITATAGTRTISLAGATLPAAGQCNITVNVTGITAGVYDNTVTVTSSQDSGGVSSTARLTVLAPACAAAIIGPLNLHDKTSNMQVNDPLPWPAGDAADGISTTAVSSTGTMISAEGQAERISDVLIYDRTGTSGSTFCFNNGNVITVTIPGVLASPAAGNGVPAAPANLDVYDSAGAAGLAVSANSSVTGGNTVITLTVTHSGTAGGAVFFPSSSGAAGAAVRIKNLRIDATSLTNSTVSVTVNSQNSGAVSPINGYTGTTQSAIATAVPTTASTGPPVIDAGRGQGLQSSGGGLVGLNGNRDGPPGWGPLTVSPTGAQYLSFQPGFAGSYHLAGAACNSSTLANDTCVSGVANDIATVATSMVWTITNIPSGVTVTFPNSIETAPANGGVGFRWNARVGSLTNAGQAGSLTVIYDTVSNSGYANNLYWAVETADNADPGTPIAYHQNPNCSSIGTSLSNLNASSPCDPTPKIGVVIGATSGSGTAMLSVAIGPSNTSLFPGDDAGTAGKIPRYTGSGTPTNGDTTGGANTVATRYIVKNRPFFNIVSTNTPPFGHLDEALNPANNSSTMAQNTTMIVAGWAADQQDGSPLTKVEIRIDGNSVGNATLGYSRPDVASAYGNSSFTNSGFQMMYNIGTLASGTHTVTAVAYDSNGATTTLNALQITVADTPPFGFLDVALDPTNNSSTIKQSTNMYVRGWAADKEDGSPVNHVAILIDGNSIGNATIGLSRPDVASAYGNSAYTNSGYQLTYNIGMLSVGSHTVTAVAYDSANVATTLNALQISVVNTPPFGFLDVALDPTNNSSTIVQSTNMWVRGWAADLQDGSPVNHVAILIDGSPIGNATLGVARPDVASAYGNSAYTNSGYQMTYNIGLLSPGSHTVSAVAYDSEGASTSLGSLQINVVNTPPFGFLDVALDPTNNSSTITQKTNMVVRGWAADRQDGAPVAQVAVLIDGVSIGNAPLGLSRPDVASAFGNSAYTNSGYQMTYNIGMLAVGSHTVSTVAKDSEGATTTLGSLQINVVNSPPLGNLDEALDPNTNSSTMSQNTTILVAGWAADPQDGAPITKVEIRIDGVAVGNATLGFSRPDVASAFSNSAYTNSGFQFTYNIGALSKTTHTVTAVAYDSEGATTTLNALQITVQ